MKPGRALALSVALWLSFSLQGCAQFPSATERRAAADGLARARGWQALSVPAGAFDIQAYAPPVPAVAQDQLTVYIEGDGLAWVTSSQVSADPTPVRPIGLQLALAQPGGQAAYLARPCQYIEGMEQDPARGCSVAYWTSRRFAPEVIEAEGLALDALKARFQARQLVLVGFSGGGAVAALLAARRQDVTRLITVAGNLDPVSWARHHGVDPLDGSLNPMAERGRLAHLPQWHVVGALDRVMPPDFAQRYASGFPPGSRPHVWVMPGHDHLCCWEASWPDLWRRMD